MELTGIRSERFSSDGNSIARSLGGQLGGQLQVLVGLANLAAVTWVFACLATWNVADPSFSNASSSVPTNAGGAAGAALADILIQFFGLASVLALVPPAIWAWFKILRRPIGRFRARLGVFLPAVLLAAAAFGCMPDADAWPLPTGLGGVTGDLLLKIPGLALGGYPSGVFALLIGMASGAVALVMTLYAAGIVAPGHAPSGELLYDPQTGEVFEDGADSPGLLIGWLAHFYYSARARMRRGQPQRQITGSHRSSGQRHTPAATRQPKGQGMIARLRGAYDTLVTPRDDGLEGLDAVRAPARGQRVHAHDADIAFDEEDYGACDGTFDALRAPPTAPDYGEHIHDPYEDEEEDDTDLDELLNAPVAAARNAATRPQVTAQHQPVVPAGARVQPMTTRLKPGARVTREAQPSLISDDRFELPQLTLLSEPKRQIEDTSIDADALEQNARLLEGVLEDFGVKGEIINVRPGPVVTLYELEPAPGIKSSRVIGLAEDIARSMSAIACRVAVVPGRNAIGIELPNQRRQMVYLRELLASRDYDQTKGRVALVLGKTIGGEPVIADLAKMPHLLVAGTTGSGKSVAINTMILSILYRLTPEQCRLIMIDPKMLELSIYDGIPHLLTPVVTDPKKAVVALKWTVREMEERYKKMSKLGVRNIDGYNARVEQAKKSGETLSRTVQTGFDRHTGEAIYETEPLELDTMPFIVVIIDEMADLMMVAGKDIEGAIQRLAQMARAAGIHVIMATQRPSVDVITGTIKANFPTRISFQVTSKIDSRTILGEQGAEQLLGMGDMLYMAGGGRIQRVHGPFVSDEEVEKIVAHLKTQGVPQYLDTITRDEDEDMDGGEGGGSSEGIDALANSNDLYDQAVAVVLRDRKVSTSYIQRRLGIGYNRAASLIERMEKEGVIGAANHAGKREILVPGENETI